MSSPTLSELKQQVMLLDEEDRKALADFLARQTDSRRKNGGQGDASSFAREMEWIKQNRESYRG